MKWLVTSKPLDDLIKEGVLGKHDKFMFESFVDNGFGKRLADGRYEFADPSQLTRQELATIEVGITFLELEKMGLIERVQAGNVRK